MIKPTDPLGLKIFYLTKNSYTSVNFSSKHFHSNTVSFLFVQFPITFHSILTQGLNIFILIQSLKSKNSVTYLRTFSSDENLLFSSQCLKEYLAILLSKELFFDQL